MNNPIPEMEVAEPKLIKPRGVKRDLLPYRLNILIDFVRKEAAQADTRLERALAIVLTGMSDGTIPLTQGKDLLNELVPAYKNNDHMHDVITLLREVDMEVAQREVERIEAMRRNGVTK